MKHSKAIKKPPKKAAQAPPARVRTTDPVVNSLRDAPFTRTIKNYLNACSIRTYIHKPCTISISFTVNKINILLTVLLTPICKNGFAKKRSKWEKSGRMREICSIADSIKRCPSIASFINSGFNKATTKLRKRQFLE